MFTHITPANLTEFLEALEKFRKSKGDVAASHWLNKMNPEYHRHVEMEMASVGGGYTPRLAKAIVRGEFDNQPLPIICYECHDGVAWYRATAGVMKCQACGSIITELDWR